jgi:protocatechuate 4,5-dioxygenase, alpha chain
MATRADIDFMVISAIVAPRTRPDRRESARREANTAMKGKKQPKKVEKEYSDIPGTIVFDAEQSRKGYGINMFCMSLMKDENRKAFKADEAAYLKPFHLTPEQTEAVLKRQWNRMLELGGNIYFTSKLGATDGLSFQQVAAIMTGSTQQEYAGMMLKGGRSPDGNRSKSEWKNKHG